MKNGFNFKKKFGQNFIKDKRIVERIVSETEIPDDTLVIEVGPGKGILTSEIIKKAKYVISYEIDLELKPYLDEKFVDSDNLEIIYDDFMNRNVEEDIEKYNFKHLYFIANVPYYITTPILMKLITLNISVEKIIMMVQEEVGNRFCASYGSKDYSSISVYLNYYFNVKKLFIVKREEFVPVPNVDSIIISLTKKDKLLDVDDYTFFFKLIKDCFQFKRKNLKNNLKGYDLEKISNILSQYNLSLSNRAEELPVEVFVAISNELS